MEYHEFDDADLNTTPKSWISPAATADAAAAAAFLPIYLNEVGAEVIWPFRKWMNAMPAPGPLSTLDRLLHSIQPEWVLSLWISGHFDPRGEFRLEVKERGRLSDHAATQINSEAGLCSR